MKPLHQSTLRLKPHPTHKNTQRLYSHLFHTSMTKDQQWHQILPNVHTNAGLGTVLYVHFLLFWLIDKKRARVQQFPFARKGGRGQCHAHVVQHA